MRCWSRFVTIGLLSLVTAVALGSNQGMTQSRAHVYLFRGLADVFSTGMDTLADELNKRGVDATSHSHVDWKLIADKVAANYKSGKEGPIILIGHSLGADAVMEMADYLGDKGVPVALVVPFDGTQSFPAPGNVARVLNLTQRDYAYMRPGPGFRGTLRNVDLSSDQDINHLNIDKAAQLHARVIAEVLAVVGGGRPPTLLAAPKPASIVAPEPNSLEDGAVANQAGNGSAKIEGSPLAKPGDGASKSTDATKSEADSGTSVNAQPGGRGPPASSAAPATPPLRTPVVAPPPINPAQIRD
jgi:alpha-beta hydrolase superfamily lysophospholipase